MQTHHLLIGSGIQTDHVHFLMNTGGPYAAAVSSTSRIQQSLRKMKGTLTVLFFFKKASTQEGGNPKWQNKGRECLSVYLPVQNLTGPRSQIYLLPPPFGSSQCSYTEKPIKGTAPPRTSNKHLVRGLKAQMLLRLDNVGTGHTHLPAHRCLCPQASRRSVSQGCGCICRLKSPRVFGESGEERTVVTQSRYTSRLL